MYFSYVLHFHRYHTSVKPSYAAVKVVNAVLAGGMLEPSGPQSGPQLAQQPPELKDHFFLKNSS
ncbi:uncharacterized protein ASPGLDRAFT_49628 [Aspergillus glaucus CBS 516.65]|uniref:Uncharacterized protein n=1 Tax=Aspergillus glaucus CBS 516.65 TaxID=1160497 RepID=A0A1L9VE76_ASPGL|nr:hypothetical protein ASPGLDRAFT_49628 [Aspergillus glaucus CBS 516.65]OJJ82220.1 hypothetical protein ASPGLDRAFT_49628 [Aspergillus glaucus CBS 516.65]